MTWAIAVGVIIFLVGVVTGSLLSRLYPDSHDTQFKEYLRREYGIRKQGPRDKG